MEQDPALLPLLLGQVSPLVPDLPDKQKVELEQFLTEFFADIRLRWPSVRLNEEEFLRYVSQKLPQEEGWVDELLGLDLEGLALIVGCLSGDVSALKIFGREVYGTVGVGLQGGAEIHELEQEVRQRCWSQLFEPENPKIRQYAGRGSLKAWLRVVLHREALMSMRRAKKEQRFDEEALLDQGVVGDNQELMYLKVVYKEAFKRVFQEVFSGLNPRERNLLRMSYLDGLNIEGIGRIYRVHRATVARWLAKIREQLLEQTKQRLCGELGVGAESVESILALLEGEMEISLPRLLGASSGTSG